MQAPYGQALVFVDVASGYTGDKCLLWPYSRDHKGYGKVQFNGKLWMAHRLVCQLVHGEPPRPRLMAAHICGTRACMTPRHLRWVTAKENEADKLRHDKHIRGERNAAARLTKAAVRAIRAQPDLPLSYWAAKYHVSKQTVCKARLRQTWTWIGEQP